MKTLLAVLLLLVPLPCHAFMPSILGGSTSSVAAAGCDTLVESCATATAAQYGMCGASDMKYVAVKFTATESSTRCSAVVPLAKISSPTMGVTASIWSDDGGSPSKPSAQVGDASTSVSASTFPGSEGSVLFEDISAPLLASTTYWLVLACDATGYSPGYFSWSRTNDCTPEYVAKSADGATWTITLNASATKFVLYK